MSRYSILPGMGGRVDVSLALTSGAAAAATDEFDASLCAQLGIQVKTWAAGDLSYLLEQSFDGTHWAAIGTTTVSVVGDTYLLRTIDGPFGLIRIKATSSDTSATATWTIVGYPIQWSF